MRPSHKTAIEIQRRYYTDLASRYDTMHAHEGDDDRAAIKFLQVLLRLVEARTVLDVGAGTGRAIRHLLQAAPDLRVCGVEPVAALIAEAVRKNGIPEGALVRAVGEQLPFRDASFDAVCSFALLHHVPEPEAVIREMMRVARKAVFISDGNRFGEGAGAVRLLKLFLYKSGLWRIANYIKTRGKGYLLTVGDGLAYSYSVYDSFDYIAKWADRLILIPAQPGKAKSWLHPLLNSPGVMVCALKEDALSRSSSCS